MTKKLLFCTSLLMAVILLFGGCGSAGPAKESGTESETVKIYKKKNNGVTYEPPPSVTLSEIKETDYAGYGFQIAEDGTVMLGGREYYGYGVNFFPALSIALDREFGIYPSPDPEIYIKALADNGIPYFRCMFGLFYGNTLQYYTKESNRTKYLRAMDHLVGLCEKYNVGMIASLFWNFEAFADYCGESYDALEDEESKTIRLQKQYVKDVVGRYKYSPAIFAWEVGNEMNLQCEIKPYVDKNGKSKKISTELMNRYYKIIGDAVREEDPYRMITGGDAQPRQNAMSLIKGSGGKNTYDDIRQLFELYTPSPLDAISVHYPILDLTDDYINAAKELKIGFYIGECFSTEEYVHQSENAEERKNGWDKTLGKYRELGVQLMTYWCYGSYSQAKKIDADSIELGVEDDFVQNEFVAESLKNANEEFVKAGKSGIADYWKNAQNAIDAK